MIDVKPWYPSRDHGSLALARWRAEAIMREFGAEHPAALAALGRWRALAGHQPGRFNDGPQHVAWQRASGSAPGWLNRAERKAIRRRGQS